MSGPDSTGSTIAAIVAVAGHFAYEGITPQHLSVTQGRLGPYVAVRITHDDADRLSGGYTLLSRIEWEIVHWEGAKWYVGRTEIQGYRVDLSTEHTPAIGPVELAS